MLLSLTYLKKDLKKLMCFVLSLHWLLLHMLKKQLMIINNYLNQYLWYLPTLLMVLKMLKRFLLSLHWLLLHMLKKQLMMLNNYLNQYL